MPFNGVLVHCVSVCTCTYTTLKSINYPLLGYKIYTVHVCTGIQLTLPYTCTCMYKSWIQSIYSQGWVISKSVKELNQSNLILSLSWPSVTYVVTDYRY